MSSPVYLLKKQTKQQRVNTPKNNNKEENKRKKKTSLFSYSNRQISVSPQFLMYLGLRNPKEKSSGVDTGESYASQYCTNFPSISLVHITNVIPTHTPANHRAVWLKKREKKNLLFLSQTRSKRGKQEKEFSLELEGKQARITEGKLTMKNY